MLSLFIYFGIGCGLLCVAAQILVVWRNSAWGKLDLVSVVQAFLGGVGCIAAIKVGVLAINTSTFADDRVYVFLGGVTLTYVSIQQIYKAIISMR